MKALALLLVLLTVTVASYYHSFGVISLGPERRRVTANSGRWSEPTNRQS
jgi:hypothetical protein